MRSAMGAHMDAILFGVKRAHMALEHRVAAPLLEPWGLTPARFDAMHVIAGRFLGTSQSRLRRALGIAGTTLGRMLKSLEALGLVEREVYRRGRRRNVQLTQRGRFLLRHATRKTRKHVRRGVDATYVSSPGSSFEDREHVDWLCKVIRTRLGDSAQIYYPWHPDD